MAATLNERPVAFVGFAFPIDTGSGERLNLFGQSVREIWYLNLVHAFTEVDQVRTRLGLRPLK
jgi:hypothetical protein